MIINEKIFAIERFSYISQAPSLTLSPHVIYAALDTSSGKRVL